MPLTAQEELNLREKLDAGGLSAIEELGIRESLDSGNPQSTPQKEQSFAAGVGERFLSVAEPIVTIGSAAISEAAGGFASLGPLVTKGPEAAQRTQEQFTEAGTFQPISKSGKEGLEALANFGPIKTFVEALQVTQSVLGEGGFQVAGPIGGAVTSVIPTAVLEVLGLGGLKKLRLGKADFIDNQGKPTPELQSALDESGVAFEELTPAAVDELRGAKQGADPQEAARKSRFEEQGIPFTKGNVSQKFEDVANEQRLLTLAGDKDAEPLRRLALAQSQVFTKRVNQVVDSLGGAEDSGRILKDALDGKIKLLKKEKSALYKEFGETAPELQNIPIIVDELVDALPSKQVSRRIERLVPGPAGALDDLMVEFGLDKNPAKIKKFTDAGNDITPLDIGNFEDFRQGINQIERADQTNAIKVLSGPLKFALDKEATLIDNAVKARGISDQNILAPLKKARETVRQIKTEFSPDAIAGKLTKSKRDGFTPFIEASQAVDKVIGPNVPIENLERVVSTLNKSGVKGKRAIQSLQASVVLNALNDALKAPTRKIGGTQTITTNAFDKSLRKFGDDKLAILFKDNKSMLKKIKDLQKTAEDITPTSTAVPKGSAPVLLDIMSRFLGQGSGKVGSAVRFIVNAGGDAKVVKRAIDAKPSFRRSVQIIKKEFPELATAIGIGGIGEGLPDVQREEQAGEPFFDQGTVEQREIRRGISRESEQELAQSLGF